MESLAGHLLIAVPAMEDANFFRTVVLVFQHTEEGASGVVINRPSDVSIVDVWKQITDEPCHQEGMVFVGGPVEGPLIALHSNRELGETPVVDDVFVSVGRTSLNQLVKQPDEDVRIYSGYSGWGANQLESEIDQGGWLTLPAVAGLVFDSPDGLWKQVCEQVGDDVLKSSLGNHIPDNPSLN